jgi:hypothetical protein
MNTASLDLSFESDLVADSSLKPAGSPRPRQSLSRRVTTTTETLPTESGWTRGSESVGSTHDVLYDARVAKRMKLARLKETYFTRTGRDDRVKRALKALAAPGPSFRLSEEMWRWVAEEVDIEDV